MVAAGCGRRDVVEELLTQGADVNAQDEVRHLRGYRSQ